MNKIALKSNLQSYLGRLKLPVELVAIALYAFSTFAILRKPFKSYDDSAIGMGGDSFFTLATSQHLAWSNFDFLVPFGNQPFGVNLLNYDNPASYVVIALFSKIANIYMAYNIFIVINLVLNGFVVFLTVKKITNRIFTSVFMGLLGTLSTPLLIRSFGHAALIGAFLLPTLILILLNYEKIRLLKIKIWIGCLFTIVFYSSVYTIIVIHIYLIMFLFFHKVRWTSRIQPLIIPYLISLFLASPRFVSQVYLTVVEGFSNQNTGGQKKFYESITRDNILDIGSLFSPPPGSVFNTIDVFTKIYRPSTWYLESSWFVGPVFSTLLILSFFYIQSQKQDLVKMIKQFNFVVISLVLLFGFKFANFKFYGFSSVISDFPIFGLIRTPGRLLQQITPMVLIQVGVLLSAIRRPTTRMLAIAALGLSCFLVLPSLHWYGPKEEFRGISQELSLNALSSKGAIYLVPSGCSGDFTALGLYVETKLPIVGCLSGDSVTPWYSGNNAAKNSFEVAAFSCYPPLYGFAPSPILGREWPRDIVPRRDWISRLESSGIDFVLEDSNLLSNEKCPQRFSIIKSELEKLPIISVSENSRWILRKIQP